MLHLSCCVFVPAALLPVAAMPHLHKLQLSHCEESMCAAGAAAALVEACAGSRSLERVAIVYDVRHDDMNTEVCAAGQSVKDALGLMPLARHVRVDVQGIGAENVGDDDGTDEEGAGGDILTDEEDEGDEDVEGEDEDGDDGTEEDGTEEDGSDGEDDD